MVQQSEKPLQKEQEKTLSPIPNYQFLIANLSLKHSLHSLCKGFFVKIIDYQVLT